MNNDKIFLASNIKYLRMLNGKTQEEVGEVCNKKNTAVSNWEKGIREPDAVDLSALSNFFHISIDDLMLKDLSSNKNEQFNELEVLFDKNKNILTNDDKEYIKFIIEKRKKEIDEQLNNGE